MEQKRKKNNLLIIKRGKNSKKNTSENNQGNKTIQEIIKDRKAPKVVVRKKRKVLEKKEPQKSFGEARKFSNTPSRYNKDKQGLAKKQNDNQFKDKSFKEALFLKQKEFKQNKVLNDSNNKSFSSSRNKKDSGKFNNFRGPSRGERNTRPYSTYSPRRPSSAMGGGSSEASSSASSAQSGRYDNRWKDSNNTQFKGGVRKDSKRFSERFKNKHTSGTGFYSKRKKQEKNFDLRRQFKNHPAAATSIPSLIKVTESVTVADFAKKMNIKASEIISKIFNMGGVFRINDLIDIDTMTIIAEEYNCKVELVSLREEVKIKEELDSPDTLEPRAPIITVMGHVDHGKTKLLDQIRKTDVASKEVKGITQHIGASEVFLSTGTFKNKKIVFLDTPGHEAFANMRMQGVQVTDIVLLVVAADSGVMPQTIESINHAKLAGIPIVVAINKIDHPNSNVEKIKKELAEQDVLAEDWGGSVMFFEVSALKNINIQELLEGILLQAEILELKANPNKPATGVVIESKLDVGKGPVSTIMIQSGTLEIGDFMIAGTNIGKLKAMLNSRGESIKTAGPSTPVEALGLNGVCNAGDHFNIIKDEAKAKEIAQKRKDLARYDRNKKIKRMVLSELPAYKNMQEIKIILKADVQGSLTAIKQSLDAFSNKEVKIVLVHWGVGPINESDIMLASLSGAFVLAFNVQANSKALALAQEQKISIFSYLVIYDIIDKVKSIIESLFKKAKETVYGKAEITKLFNIQGLGVVIGASVSSGKMVSKSLVRVFREDKVIFETKIKSLKRYQKDVESVKSGLECGILIQGYQELLRENDIIESFSR